MSEMTKETTLGEMRDSFDWAHVLEYASPPDRTEGFTGSVEGFTFDDVAEVIASADGSNDGPTWAAILRLNDGRFIFVEAGCDYTGWDCQASGVGWVAADLASLIQFGVPQEARDRLGAHP